MTEEQIKEVLAQMKGLNNSFTEFTYNLTEIVSDISERVKRVETEQNEHTDKIGQIEQKQNALSDRIQEVDEQRKIGEERAKQEIIYQHEQIELLKSAVRKLVDDDKAVIWRSRCNDLVGIDKDKAYSEFSACKFTSTEAMRELHRMGMLKKGDSNHYCSRVKIKRKPTYAVVLWKDFFD